MTVSPTWATMPPITDVFRLFRYQRAIRTFTDEAVPHVRGDDADAPFLHQLMEAKVGHLGDDDDA